MSRNASAAFFGLVNLASARLGAAVLAVTDEFFAEASNLLSPREPVFDPERFTERGKWMDGWESRRRREPGHDHVTIRLGLPGRIRGLDIDTSHFLGNHPAFASLEGCWWEGEHEAAPPPEDAPWQPLLAPSALRPGSHNLFAVSNDMRCSHVRLHIYPDGGVARLRVYGEVAPDPDALRGAQRLDLAALANGARAVACSDMFFGDMQNLIWPGRAANMGEGWETRRRRGPGHDWVVVQLAGPGRIACAEIDTHHFKGNAPARAALDALSLPEVSVVDLGLDRPLPWRELLPAVPLEPDTLHRYESELRPVAPVTHVRLRIEPDGGVSRLRLWGRLVDADEESGA
ncbi:MAG: allantoicase [Planctomycetota bacterium]|nr:MAG: allantoicase [Planctomycetota bacterium]